MMNIFEIFGFISPKKKNELLRDYEMVLYLRLKYEKHSVEKLIKKINTNCLIDKNFKNRSMFLKVELESILTNLQILEFGLQKDYDYLVKNFFIKKKYYKCLTTYFEKSEKIIYSSSMNSDIIEEKIKKLICELKNPPLRIVIPGIDPYGEENWNI